MEDVTLLNPGSNVVVSSGLLRTQLASPLIRRESLADLVIKCSQIRQRTGNPVYFVSHAKCKARERAMELLEAARTLELSPSPSYDPKAIRKMLNNHREARWQEEWVNSGTYYSMTNRLLPYAYQTKQWFPITHTRAGIMKFGRPTLGDFIQFLTGHGWFRIK